MEAVKILEVQPRRNPRRKRMPNVQTVMAETGETPPRRRCLRAGHIRASIKVSARRRVGGAEACGRQLRWGDERKQMIQYVRRR